MNKHLLGLALVSALGLAGCGGGDGPADPKVPDGTAGSGGNSASLTRPIFAPGSGQLPLPNDLLFSGTTDLTLRLPAALRVPGLNDDKVDEIYIDPSPANPNSAYAANHLFAQDGWSAVAPFIIQFTNLTPGISVDAATMVGGSTIRVFKAVVLRTPSPTTGVVPPTGPVIGIASELAVGTDYRVDLVATSEDSTGRTLRVTPINPLEENATYLVVLTNGIKDSNGNGLIADGQFAIAKTTSPLDPNGSTAALEPVRQLVNAQLAAAAAAGVNRDDVVLSSQFTVQGIGDALSTISMVVNNPMAPAPTSSGFAPKAPFNAISAALDSGAVLWQGQVTIPYYLTAPTMGNPLAPLKEFWMANTDILPGTLLGSNLSYVNRIPKATGNETIPMLLAVPGGDCAKPGTGWPVMIFQHGITGHRGQMLPIANTMAKSPICMATVAIDLPLHGLRAASDYTSPTDIGLATLLHVGYTPGGVRERIFGVDYVNNISGASGPDTVVDASGTHFINLTSPLTSRDNLREAAADLLALSRALTTMDYDTGGADFDVDKVYFAGLSLGAITGANFVAYDPRVKAAVLVSPGGGLGKMVPVSPAFGPTINGGLAAAGRLVGSAGYEQFLWLLQTVVDQGDPLANWQQFRAAGVPTLMFQVKNDLVVPNDGSLLTYQVPASPPFPIPVPANVAAIAPYAGTTPLARAFGLANISSDQPLDLEGVSGFIRFNTGCHSSLLSIATCAPATTDPALAAAVTVEMNTIIAKYFASNGALVDVTNTAIIEP